MTTKGEIISKTITPIAISMGDPAGIGPEIILKSWLKREELAIPHFFVVGNVDCLKHYNPQVPLAIIKEPSDAVEQFSTALPVIDLPINAQIVAGEPNVKNSQMVIDAIELAVKFVKEKQASAIVTAPINKHNLYEAGFSHKGHTDFLAHLNNQNENDAVMMLHCEQLSVVPLTIHIPLRDVAKTISEDKIIKTTKTMLNDLSSRFGYSNPRVAITGLNPHAGENGTMGDEEEKIIKPAIKQLQSQGLAVFGPFAADSLFSESERNKYDAILAMYHDQALGPLKALDMANGVNITLGLDKLIRTSPDHGTAYEVAGLGMANPNSFIKAIFMAHRLASSNG